MELEKLNPSIKEDRTGPLGDTDLAKALPNGELFFFESHADVSNEETGPNQYVFTVWSIIYVC